MWIEIVFWVLIIGFALIGLKKGLFDSILSLVGTAIAVVAAVFLAKPAASFINKIVDIPSMMSSLVDKVFANSENVEVWGSVFEKQDLATFLSLLFAGIIVYILVKLAIWLLSKLFDGVASKSTAISGLNRLFGLLFGLIKGGFVVCVLLAMCSIITETQVVGNSIDDTIDKAPTTKWVYSYVDKFTEDTLSKIDLNEYLKNLIKEKATDTEQSTEQETVASLPYEIIIEVPQSCIN